MPLLHDGCARVPERTLEEDIESVLTDDPEARKEAEGLRATAGER